jgi:hypothetical protein
MDADACESGLTHYAENTILWKKTVFRPGKPHYLQQLFPDVCNRRKDFAEAFLRWNDDWPQLFDNIPWSDKAVFHIGGFMN